MRWSWVRVRGQSMLPRLRPGDLLLVNRAVSPVPGALVVLDRPDRPGDLLVKRVHRRVEGGWEVRGDDPDLSTDSAVFGPVPNALVVGRVVARLWPRPRRFRDG